ncbi:hypothetical protein BZA05DRAFT_371241 [Tricharina praecox]|uniref:uncharacterized protein n=1 Tax=Tricharina praecox TaxID=43433 RepID=UPI00221EF181|nr:uncharacterized protein BZA05DRAFT_371241 [Tricharina praecox]KAI5854110.1 hypothetical protein BZA05DRAFT_371241 [Tricharina praecox]
MKSFIPFSLLAAAALSSALVLPTEDHQFAALSSTSSADSELRQIQLSPFETRWVTEDQKLELKRQGINFMDITEHPSLGLQNAVLAATSQKPTVKFPDSPAFQKTIKPLLSTLDKSSIQANLEKFTSFYTRYAKSDYGRQSSEWLQNRVIETAAGYKNLEVKPFPHSWGQNSIIARIPGRTNKTVVIGAHQDSINLFLPSLLGAPGADDDGSGTVTILEAFRVFIKYLADSGETLEQTVEFHWYSAEELGLLGSQAIFSSYEKEGRDVVAMLQQDMTGFVEKTLKAGKPEAVGVITDYVDQGLTEFIKKVITEYCDIPWTATACGYACSDHASASKAGYPSAFVIESAFEDSDNHIHTTEDKIEYLSFDHMLQHAKLTLGLAMELGSTKMWSEKKSGVAGSQEL